MCCIYFKNKNDLFCGFDTIKKIFRTNPDGAGFMLLREGKIYTVHNTCTQQIAKELQKIGIRHSDILLLHSRIATHGTIKTENCHPFFTRYKNRLFMFAHNGMLNIKPQNDKTDSQTAFDDIYMPIIKSGGNPKIAMEAVGGYNNRQILLTLQNHHGKYSLQKITMSGNWTKDETGYYSNLLFKLQSPYSLSDFGWELL